MVDLITFKNEVRLIVNNLAKAVATEIFMATHKVSLIKPNADMEERLCDLVAGLCGEAVEKILKMVELSDTDPPESEQSGDALMKTRTTGGDDCEGPSPFTEQTFILVCGSAAADSCLTAPRVVGESKTSSTDAAGEIPASHPPPRADFSDHEYARPSSPRPGAATVQEAGVSADGSSSSRRRRRRKEGSDTVSAETHHECSQCRMLFPTPERLSDHQQKSHPACSVCGTLFTGVLKLREHESQAHGLLPYTCDYCPKRFNHKAHRDLHVKARHTGEKTCHCDICGKGYSCISVLKTHRTTHFEKTFICDVCGKSFYHACHLTRHKLVHQEVRPYRCFTCGKGFTQAANLHSHQMMHTGDRQLCSICGKSFRCLKNHIISKHSHELPADELPARDSIITCEVCGKKFPNASQFKVHQRSHTGEKPFHCDICGKSYRLKELLRDHRYTHTGEKPYKCSLCSKTFNLATSFMRHRSIHSGATPYSCHECGKHFRLLAFLKAHLQTKAHLKQVQQQTVSSDS